MIFRSSTICSLLNRPLSVLFISYRAQKWPRPAWMDTDSHFYQVSPYNQNLNFASIYGKLLPAFYENSQSEPSLSTNFAWRWCLGADSSNSSKIIPDGLFNNSYANNILSLATSFQFRDNRQWRILNNTFPIWCNWSDAPESITIGNFSLKFEK